MSSKGWVGVDLDGTLAHYSVWKGPEHIGEPIKPMVDRVKKWLVEGKDVRIFTARVFAPHGDAARQNQAATALLYVQTWCEVIIGKRLPVTCVKDFDMIELWDDRAVQVVTNTGIPVTEQIVTDV